MGELRAALADQQATLTAQGAQIVVLEAAVSPEVAAEAAAARAAVLAKAGRRDVSGASALTPVMEEAMAAMRTFFGGLRGDASGDT